MIVTNTLGWYTSDRISERQYLVFFCLFHHLENGQNEGDHDPYQEVVTETRYCRYSDVLLFWFNSGFEAELSLVSGVLRGSNPNIHTVIVCS